jgi:hypothetical protein
MGVIISPQADIDAYFESEALSQSTLKGLLKGFDSFVADQKKEDTSTEVEHFIIGSAVDCILTGEHGEFNKQYYVSQLEKKPSEKEMSIIKQVYDELASEGVFDNEENSISLGDCYDMVKMSCDDHAWQMKWKTETRVTKIVEAGSEYFNDLVASYGKTILSQEQNQKIHTIVNSLRTNGRTERYFNRERQAEMPPTFEFYYQLPIYFTYKGVDCKALMDIVVVEYDTEGNIVNIWPYDLKTMSGNNKYFLNSLKSRRYDIQAAWYIRALSLHFKVPILEINPFTFIVESSTVPGRPLLFEIDKSLYEIGQSGREAVKLVDTNLFDEGKNVNIDIVKEIKGIDQLMEEYLWYVEQGWQEDKDISEADGYMKINWEGFV